MAALYPYSETAAWPFQIGGGLTGSTGVVYSTATAWGSNASFAPAKQPTPAPTKADKARAAMRRFLVGLPAESVRQERPELPKLAARDPLREHRRRAFRRTPRRSIYERAVA